MGVLERTLATIAVCGGLGAFIDFYIGKRGQQRVRSWLETWWLRLSDVRWGNFGREEALFAVETLDRLFGPRLLSARRLISTLAITLVFSGIMIFLIGDFRLHGWFSYEIRIVGQGTPLLIDDLVNVVFFIVIVLSFAISFSVTRLAANIVATLIGKVPFFNFGGITLLIAFQYILLCYWAPTTQFVHVLLVYFLPVFNIVSTVNYEAVAEYVKDYFPLADFSLNYKYQISNVLRIFDNNSVFGSTGFVYLLSKLLSIIPSLIRFLIMFIFLGSFLLKPFQRPIMTLWARIVEVDKPVFTLLFGGIAAFAKGIQEIIKVL